MRTIGVVTVGRSDYGIYRPLLGRIRDEPDLRLHLLVSGTHLSPDFGLTVSAIQSDGFAIGERIEMLVSSDSPEGIAKSIGLGVIGFSQALARHRPDILVVLGDRFEMYAAVIAALPLAIPVAHIHGGELTLGAIDDALRHSMTKLSHLHFVATEAYARRVEQLGEEPWRVTVSGAPALDNLSTVSRRSLDELRMQYDLPDAAAPLLVTYHPVTVQPGQAASQIETVLRAIDASGMPAVFTQPNADAEGRHIGALIDAYVASHANAVRIDSFGVQGYFSMMSVAAAMVGNSSSGLIEAPSFGLPVVNIGLRQAGRVRGANVIDVDCDEAAILAAIREAVSPAFRALLGRASNPYGTGHASDAIVNRLKTEPLDARLMVKRFHDVPVASLVSRDA